MIYKISALIKAKQAEEKKYKTVNGIYCSCVHFGCLYNMIQCIHIQNKQKSMNEPILRTHTYRTEYIYSCICMIQFIYGEKHIYQRAHSHTYIAFSFVTRVSYFFFA